MTADSSAYGLIAEAIRYLDSERESQPSLAEVAEHLGVSPSHFQRTFSRWVGVSPKRYVQYLTLGHAKQRLAERGTVLDAALDSGLSSPGRLHDLFVTWEAMTPGEYARRGDGLAIRYGRFDSQFGEVLALATDRGLCGLAFTAELGWNAAFDDMRSRWPLAEFRPDPEGAAPWVRAAFDGGEPHLVLTGTPFQVKVWEALLAIPSGALSTYAEIAARAGAPGAARATGAAVGRNPVSWLIPCHRVVRGSGALGGYRWGLGAKRAMLAWEAARSDAGGRPSGRAPRRR